MILNWNAFSLPLKLIIFMVRVFLLQYPLKFQHLLIRQRCNLYFVLVSSLSLKYWPIYPMWLECWNRPGWEIMNFRVIGQSAINYIGIQFSYPFHYRHEHGVAVSGRLGPLNRHWNAVNSACSEGHWPLLQHFLLWVQVRLDLLYFGACGQLNFTAWHGCDVW